MSIERFQPEAARIGESREGLIGPWSVFKTAAIDHSATPPRWGISSIQRVTADRDLMTGRPIYEVLSPPRDNPRDSTPLAEPANERSST